MIVVVTSWRGIGATTTALVVATTVAAMEPAWLIEADPAGGVLTGRMDFAPDERAGLERVAFPSDRCTPWELFAAVAHEIGSLRVVTAPADPFRAHACHSPRVPWAPALRDLDGVIVIDIGRLRAGSPAQPLLALADVIVLVSSPEVSSAVASAEWVHARGRISSLDPELSDATIRLVVVDAPSGAAFPRSALQVDLGEQFGGWLPWEPTTVDLLHREVAAADRRLRRSPLLAAAREMLRQFDLEPEVVR